MSLFIWNINFLLFWRLAWLKEGVKYPDNCGWFTVGRLALSKQSYPYRFYIAPAIIKIKKLLAKL